MCGPSSQNSCTAFFSLTVCSTFKEYSGTIKECSLNEKANNPSLGSKSKTSSNIEIGAAPTLITPMAVIMEYSFFLTGILLFGLKHSKFL